MNLCTLSDIQFLHLGLTLYESLTPSFTLYYLALDGYTATVLHALNLSNLRILTLADIDDGSLSTLRTSPPSPEAITVARASNKSPQEVQFLWALSSYLCSWILWNTDADHIAYVDADVCFFGDQNVLLSKAEGASIGLVEHRIANTAYSGKYNVGVVFFRNDVVGLQAADFWKGCMLDSNNPHAKEYGVCGDQKYIELFEQTWPVLVFDQVGVNHGAPWNIESTEKDLLYFHFSNFSADYERKTYIPAKRHGIVQVSGFLKVLYDKYYRGSEQWKRVVEKTLQNSSG